MSKKTTEISAGSMADIAFLLLIFFLVTTTMDADIGISRKLPPPIEDSTIIDIPRRNILNILINKSDKLQVNKENIEIGMLRKTVKEFLRNDDLDLNWSPQSLPTKKEKNIPIFGGVVYISKGIISLKNDRGTSYKMYVSVQNEITAAINELRDELSLKKFGMKYHQLSDEEKIKAIRTAIPMAISEAEPKNIGGN